MALKSSAICPSTEYAISSIIPLPPELIHNHNLLSPTSCRALRNRRMSGIHIIHTPRSPPMKIVIPMSLPAPLATRILQFLPATLHASVGNPLARPSRASAINVPIAAPRRSPPICRRRINIIVYVPTPRADDTRAGRAMVPPMPNTSITAVT